ncbi:MAG: restriction endonuclease subunit S [Nostoc sp.]
MGEIQLPSHWKVVTLGDVARIERGKFAHRPRNDPAFYGGDIPFIQTGDVTASNGYVKNYAQTLNQKGLSVSKFFPKGTIVITIAANIGYTAILEFDSAFPDSLIGITPNNKTIPVDAEYLNYYLWTQQLEMDRQAPRGTQKNINIQFLNPWRVVVPPLPEQKTIAHTLRTIQKAKETRQRELELERERKAALMQYLFTHGTSNEPRGEKKIGKIPESWGIVPFKSITVSGTQNGIYKSKEFYGRGYQIADMKDIFKGEVLEIGNMDKLDLDDEELAKFRLYEGDLIFARRSFKPEGAGKCQFIPTLKEPVVFSSSIIRVSLNKEIAEPRFYAYFFNSEIGNQLIRQITRILAVSGISGSDLKNLLVPVLTQKEQKEIVATLQNCDRKIQALEKEIALTDELFHAMLEQLMTGKISTQPLTETYV